MNKRVLENVYRGVAVDEAQHPDELTGTDYGRVVRVTVLLAAPKHGTANAPGGRIAVWVRWFLLLCVAGLFVMAIASIVRVLAPLAIDVVRSWL